ncbi:MAG: translation initiation factor IF-3 [Parcubacteria group bacterium]|nr:translation initiation factor IF-3 [Parcubacteria group bacterium]
MRNKERINNRIRALQLRVIGAEGENFGVLSLEEALKKAQEHGLDLIEISPDAQPPVAKIMDYGKFRYEQKKKDRGSKSPTVETKSLQIKIGTGEHDLALKARKASGFLKDGNRVKIELFLGGRAKYLDKKFLEERLNRILNLITENYKIADGPKRSPKGLAVVLERSK